MLTAPPLLRETDKSDIKPFAGGLQVHCRCLAVAWQVFSNCTAVDQQMLSSCLAVDQQLISS